MHFGTYLVAFFCPPMYFLIRGRWGAAILNGFVYLIAVLLLFSIVFAIFSPIPWLFCMAHAMWNVRKQIVLEAAETLATKMAEKMRPLPVADPAPPLLPPSMR